MNLNWIVAIVAPRDIAVHPNFGEETYSAPRALASRLKGWDFAVRDQGERLLPDTSVDARSLLEASRNAFQAGEEGLAAKEVLLKLAREGEDLALATASCLFYAVSAADDDDYERLFSALTTGIRRLGDVDPVPAVELLHAVLLLQQALRASESGGNVLGFAESAQALLEGIRWDAMGPVEVSPGVSWGTEQVWLRVRSELESVALSHVINADPFSHDRSWSQAVRRQSPPVRTEFVGSGAEGLAKYVGERFDFLTKDPSIVLGGGDTIEGPVVLELMHYELTGNRSARESRRVLGQIRVLRKEHHGSLDALRLMRQSGDSKAFGKAVRYFRANGPLFGVREEAIAVVERRRVDWWRDVDLEALAYGADLLSADEASRGYEKAETYLSKIAASTSGRFAMDTLMSAIAALAHVAGTSEQLAKHVYDLVQNAPQDQSLMNAYGRGIGGIDWGKVTTTTTTKWRKWLISAPNGVDYSSLRLALSAAVGLPSESRPAKPTLSDIGAELNSALRSSERAVPSDRAAQFTDVLIESMNSIQRDAAAGRFGFGGLSPVDLAVMLALEHPSEALWSAIVAFLADERLPREMKAEAIERLTASGPSVPAATSADLKQHYDALSRSPARAFAFGEASGSFSPVVSLAAALDLVSEDRLLSDISRLASDLAPRSRVEAAKALKALARRLGTVPSWGFVLLVQLTRDSDATVRAHGGQALALAHVDDAALATLWGDTVRTLLKEDGVLAPLLMLRGLAERWAHGAYREIALMDTIRELRSTSLSHIVRDASEVVLRPED